ncbi:MAG TPA: hypothetical protein VHD33_00700 [Legionellaceae bacterium]|nr:hypothetical protein [Legionellaceae bacterium]
MSRIHYFQRYNAKENWVTNATLLLLSRLYHYSPSKFKTVINEIVSEENKVELEIGVVFSQQLAGLSSVVDGVISQESFKIAIETKLNDNFIASQLKNHLQALAHAPGKKILLALSKGPVPLTVRSEVITELQKVEYQDIHFASTTYNNIIKVIEDTMAEYETEMLDILDDYRSLCKENNLTDTERYTMLAVTASTSIDINRKYNIYYDPATRSHNIPFYYLALYEGRSIVAVGRLTKIIYCDYENGKLVSSNGYPLTLTAEEYDRIKTTIEETPYYDLRRGVKFFLVEKFIDTNFQKISPSGLRAKKYFFLNDPNTIKGYNENMSVEEIAEVLKHNTW